MQYLHHTAPTLNTDSTKVWLTQLGLRHAGVGHRREQRCLLCRTLNFCSRWTSLVYNSLPVQLSNPDITYGLFRRQLKGHLFSGSMNAAFCFVTSDMRRFRKTLTYLLTYWDSTKPMSGNAVAQLVAWPVGRAVRRRHTAQCTKRSAKGLGLMVLCFKCPFPPV